MSAYFTNKIMVFKYSICKNTQIKVFTYSKYPSALDHHNCVGVLNMHERYIPCNKKLKAKKAERGIKMNQGLKVKLLQDNYGKIDINITCN